MIARLYFSWVYIPNERTQESGHLTPSLGSYVSRWLGVYQVVPPSFRNALRIVSFRFFRRPKEINRYEVKLHWTSQPSDVSSSNSLITFLPLFLKNHYWNHPDSWPTLDFTQGDWSLGLTIPIKTQRDGSSPGEMVQSKMRPI